MLQVFEYPVATSPNNICLVFTLPGSDYESSMQQLKSISDKINACIIFKHSISHNTIILTGDTQSVSDARNLIHNVFRPKQTETIIVAKVST